ncbi:adhesion G protein-coupled receptor E3-like [Carassius gibelio]|uniref:adhesion G protein-coupled receptor E3-like n=1 Tax=Carassius gibelio TaxID=101364 RepID=UPI002277CD53|nr:adhesion G protein-coupled receptor E3-like [Carassius gibelio]
MLEDCKITGKCVENLLGLIENSTVEVLPLIEVTKILDVVLNATEKVVTSSSADPNKLVSDGNRLLKASEKLVSMLVRPTNTSVYVNFTLDTVEGQVFMVGPQVTLDKIPQLDTSNSSVDIDLIGIAKNNNKTRSAAVAFMSYNTMENLLKPDFFNTPKDTIKTMMSTVTSATLPKTSNTTLTKPVIFTLKHIREFDPNGSLSCVYWNISEWIVDGCSVLTTTSSYTVCSCDHLSTFALIMQTSRPRKSDSLMELLNLVCVIVGLVFFSLALLTFALCRWSPGVNNVARINICISLLLAHLLFLLTQQFLSLIRPLQVLCAVISGLLQFLFLSGFVWMFIEAVLLFICVENLSQISSINRTVLSREFLCVMGYVVALVVVSVSVVVDPKGYGSEMCWIKIDKGFISSFLGPVCMILTTNTILFIKIVLTLNSTLKNLNSNISQIKQTKIMAFKTLAQFVVLGCSWILGFFTNDSEVLEILFLILNSQQGTFIFLIYCVLNNEVRQQYRKFFRCLCCGQKQHQLLYMVWDHH